MFIMSFLFPCMHEFVELLLLLRLVEKYTDHRPNLTGTTSLAQNSEQVHLASFLCGKSENCSACNVAVRVDAMHAQPEKLGS